MADDEDEIERLKARLAALEGQKSATPDLPPASAKKPGGGCGQYFAIGLLGVGILYGLAQCGSSSESTTSSYTASSWTPPEGYVRFFNARGGQVATKWDRATRQECRGSGVVCFALDVVAETGCPRSLYAEVTLLDADGRNIGWTNDTAQGVMAGERTRLVFDTYERGAETARIAEINCY